jgi:hypothetical protein
MSLLNRNSTPDIAAQLRGSAYPECCVYVTMYTPAHLGSAKHAATHVCADLASGTGLLVA